MNTELLSYLYIYAKKSKMQKILIPSVRGLAIKFGLSNNDIVRTMNYYKEQGIIVTEQGSQTHLMRDRFLHTFKNDTNIFFGNDVERKIISNKIKKYKNQYEHNFVRDFIKNNDIVGLSHDRIYVKSNSKIELKEGIDEYIKRNIPGTKIVLKETSIIDITNFQEYKKLKASKCVILETKIFNMQNKIISHSFSLFPIEHYRDYKIETMI